MLGDNIKRLMRENGYTQKQLAMRAGCGESAICRYVNNEREPSIRILKNLAIALGVTVDELISEDGVKKDGLILTFDGATGYFPKEFIVEAIKSHMKSEGAWITVHWANDKKSPRGRHIIYKTYTCDVCGKSNGRHKTKYCPHCGAKMKGGE